jgi:hypothetical protein
MQRNIKTLTTELIELPKKERLEIVRFLLFPDTPSLDSDGIESVWEKEISDRVRAVDEGTAIGIDYDTAMKKLEKRFALCFSCLLV